MADHDNEQKPQGPTGAQLPQAQDEKPSAAPPADTGPQHQATAPAPRRDRFWAVVGKVGTAVAILVGLGTLVRWMWPAGPEVEAQCQIVHGVVLPLSVLGQNSSEFIEYDWSPDHFESLLLGDYRAVPPNDIKTLAQKMEDIRILSQRISEDIKVTRSRWLDHLDEVKPNDLLKCRVTNSGNEPAYQVVLDLPLAPVLAVLDGKGLAAATASQSIKVGEIRPGLATDVIAWFNAGLIPSESEYHISYQNGTGEVRLFSADYQFPGKVSRFVMLFERDRFLLIFTAILLIYVIVRLGWPMERHYEESKGGSS